MKKFCFVIAVFLVFVVSCDNLYNDVAEEKKDMQKLIFVNADGVSVDLTKDPYGITEWEGFSKVDLNLQTQQVPFHDGSVYLDGLLSERELSVTLAMNDEKNLEKRYRLRRELIEILNPKLGEGTLIYTNNYTSKQIKVIPQTPLFENHNSNDSGTPKASLAWTACDPYWEDLEEKEVTFQLGQQPIIENDGDIPVQIEMDWFTDYVKDGKVTNLTNEQKIEYSGVLNDDIKINTGFGQKSVTTEQLNIMVSQTSSFLYGVTYSEKLKLIVIVGAYGNVITSSDGKNWNITIVQDAGFTDVIYVDELDLFIAIGFEIYTSTDGINWTARSNVGGQGLQGIAYSKELGLLVAVGYDIELPDDKLIYTSTDGINWTQQTSEVSNVALRNIVYSEELHLFVMIGNTLGYGGSGFIFTSPDGMNWTEQTSINNESFSSVIYSDKLDLFVIVGSSVYISPDGINWTQQISQFSLEDVVYSDDMNMFVACGASGTILTSPDGINWTQQTGVYGTLRGITYSKELNYFITSGDYGVVYISSDGKNWTRQLFSAAANNLLYAVTYSEKQNLFVVCGQSTDILTSPDGINWTRRSVSGASGKSFSAVMYSEKHNLFIIVGGVILTSPDGINWTIVYTPPAPNIGYRSIIYSTRLDLFVTVGAYGNILTSPDGINWTEQTSGISSTLLAVTYSEKQNLFIACGESGIILTSQNGINWTQQTNGISNTLRGITYSKELDLFVIAGYSGVILTSTDGINWTQQISGVSGSQNNLYNVTFSKELNMFWGVGKDGLMLISTDGINWTQYPRVTSSDIWGVVYSDKQNKFVFVGELATILYTVFSSQENRISHLSSDSNIDMRLEKGGNHFRINKNDGNMIVRIVYRQKYIGV